MQVYYSRKKIYIVKYFIKNHISNGDFSDFFNTFDLI